jgi:hypothetical protein
MAEHRGETLSGGSIRKTTAVQPPSTITTTDTGGGGGKGGGGGRGGSDVPVKAMAALDLTSSSDEKEWKCSVCTFVNKPLALSCSMCQSEMPTPSSSSSSSQQPPGLLPPSPTAGGAASVEVVSVVSGKEAAASTHGGNGGDDNEDEDDDAFGGYEEFSEEFGDLLSGDNGSVAPKVPSYSALATISEASLDTSKLDGSLAAKLLGEGGGGDGDGVDDELAAAAAAEEEEGVELTEEATNAVLGYPIDKFQQDCLEVIVDPGMDLLAMAPTVS